MNIKIKSLTGKIINLRVEQTDTIHRVKELVQEMEGIGTDQQRIIYNGSLLKDDTQIIQAKLEPGSVLHMILALRGGGKKSDDSNLSIGSNSIKNFIVPQVIIPDDTSNLIEIDSCQDTLYEISFRNTSTNSNDSTYVSVNKSKKLCCLIL